MIQGSPSLDTVYERIDGEYRRYLEAHQDVPERWLLTQTLYSGMDRRAIYQFLPISEDARVLDIGTGFGALALDLAAFKCLQIDAIDLNQSTLRAAEDIYQCVSNANVLKEGSQITFAESNVYDLRFDDATFDIVIARYVFQHLTNPQMASQEIARVMKPGGFVCLIDIDDQLTITYPEDSASFRRLQEAFGTLQERNGGDRFVGRKLAGYLYEVGLEVVGTIIQPRAQFAMTKHDDLGLQLTVARLHEVREQIVNEGIMGASEYDACLESFVRDAAQWQFHAHGQMIVVGRR